MGAECCFLPINNFQEVHVFPSLLLLLFVTEGRDECVRRQRGT